mmetsp:Transcript_29283/g.55328  ORF Transcript_29283/g.55328 Transcript_29283/m.55328 type:complete len:202 (+) Transcript_29283:418-1023(+)
MMPSMPRGMSTARRIMRMRRRLGISTVRAFARSSRIVTGATSRIPLASASIPTRRPLNPRRLLRSMPLLSESTSLLRSLLRCSTLYSPCCTFSEGASAGLGAAEPSPGTRLITVARSYSPSSSSLRSLLRWSGPATRPTRAMIRSQSLSTGSSRPWRGEPPTCSSSSGRLEGPSEESRTLCPALLMKSTQSSMARSGSPWT